ncbi:MAG: glutathione S-transferase family protein [Alphaproteobacteria bacterium]|nr:glutathione S-transferase family protein [Alphaproteobacteria bacterium]
MAQTLYELVGRDDHRFSPFCWRTLMALRHKGLRPERVPVRFTEKPKIAFSGQELVPVLVDGATTVSDSWTIVQYLETAYPNAPALFGGAAAQAEARFINHWADGQLQPAMVRLIIGDIYACLEPADQAYYRKTREARFGMTIEALAGARELELEPYRRLLAPLRATLKEQPYLCGEAPAYADYIVFGAFQWARCSSPYPMLEASDPIFAWRQRLLERFDGFAGAAKSFGA